MRTITFVLFALLGILQYRLWFAEGGMPDMWELQQQVGSSITMNMQLSDRNSALQAEITDLKRGNAAIEEHARVDLGMVRSNETFYQVIR